ncbi:MAG: succinate dehydrogenase, cytochrome b556 subunit [Pseudomonadota bacterium]
MAEMSVRPLSPHLQVYKMLFTMLMSILHRITGVGIYFGMALLAIWLIAAASGEATFEFVNGIYGSILGQLVLVGFTWAVIHHMMGGVRHLIWDTINMLDVASAKLLARITLATSITLTIVVWAVAYAIRWAGA